MSTIIVEREHKKSPEEIQALIAEMIVELKNRFEIESEWVDEKTLKVQRSGMTGKMEVSANSVRAEIELGWMLRPLKGKILDTIDRTLEKRLA